MKSQKIDLQKIADALRERCPFVVFAIVNGLDEHGRTSLCEDPELSVFIQAGTGTWRALERILPVIAATVPVAHCDVTLLNRADAKTRFRALHGLCLFVQEDYKEHYRHFVRHASLDYRIMRAQGRRIGIIDND
jgi:hypothetical protein